MKKKGSAHNRPSTYNETLPRSSSLSSSWFTFLFFILIPTETNYFLKFYPFLVLCISLSFPIQIYFVFFLSLSLLVSCLRFIYDSSCCHLFLEEQRGFGCMHGSRQAKGLHHFSFCVLSLRSHRGCIA